MFCQSFICLSICLSVCLSISLFLSRALFLSQALSLHRAQLYRTIYQGMAKGRSEIDSFSYSSSLKLKIRKPFPIMIYIVLFFVDNTRSNDVIDHNSRIIYLFVHSTRLPRLWTVFNDTHLSSAPTREGMIRTRSCKTQRVIAKYPLNALPLDASSGSH